MPATVILPLVANPAVDFTVRVPGSVWLPPTTFVLADCVGLFGSVVSLALPSAPFGLALPLTGALLSVSALMLRLAAVIGVGSLLSTNAFDSVMKSATAMPAPSPDADESAFVVTSVLTFELIVTDLPGA